MFLTYNYCVKWLWRIVQMVQNLCEYLCEKSFVQNVLYSLHEFSTNLCCRKLHTKHSLINRTEDILPMKVKDNEPFEYRS